MMGNADLPWKNTGKFGRDQGSMEQHVQRSRGRKHFDKFHQINEDLMAGLKEEMGSRRKGQKAG